MKGYLSSQKKVECFGCGACVQVCNQNALSMMEDDEGFVYPAFDAEKCCGCEACLRACPYGNELPREGAPIAVFGGHHKNASILEDSTSGGAFSALVEAWFLREGNRAVWGAASHGIDVRHECALNFEESVRFRKSKYCQSDMGSAYADIRLQLKAGTFVLFSGTPCQVAGLRSFLGPRAYGGRLLTVEVVCEGVPTPLYLRKYIERLESGHGSKLAELDYRYKDGRRWDFQVMLATFEDGQYCKVDRWFNPFWSIWLQHLMSRPSCYCCPFAAPDRIADVTLGDLWGVHLYCPDLYSRNAGASLVVCNTEAGVSLLNDARSFLEGRNLEFADARRYQGPMRRPVGEVLSREAFMHDLLTLDIDDLEKKWAKRPSLKLLWCKYIWGNRQKVALWNQRRALVSKVKKGGD